MSWMQDVRRGVQVQFKATSKGLKIHFVPTCSVLELAKGRVTASMDCAPNQARSVIVIKDGLFFSERLIAELTGVAVLRKQVKTMCLDLRGFQPHQ